MIGKVRLLLLCCSKQSRTTCLPSIITLSCTGTFDLFFRSWLFILFPSVHPPYGDGLTWPPPPVDVKKDRDRKLHVVWIIMEHKEPTCFVERPKEQSGYIMYSAFRKGLDQKTGHVIVYYKIVAVCRLLAAAKILLQTSWKWLIQAWYKVLKLKAAFAVVFNNEMT